MIQRIVLCLLLTAAAVPAAGRGRLIGARYPALSPSGGRIAFTYMGDIWTVPKEGGRALRLTDHTAYDFRPLWSPDGRWIAFTSNRNGNNDVFLISSDGSEPVQLTWHSSGDEATGWSPDSKWIVFQSSRFSSSSIFKVPVSGGNAEALLDTYWSWPYDASLGPDGGTLLFASGMENRFHWRKGYRGSNSSKLSLLTLGSAQTREIVSDRANSFRPCWSSDGTAVYFLSDRENGTGNIWRADIQNGGIRPVTSFKEHDVRGLSAAAAADLLVYERDFGIWLTDPATGRSAAVPIDAPSEFKSSRELYVKDGRVSEYAVSPDGKKIAAVVRGDIFILSPEGGYARNVTETAAKESNVIWDKTSSHVIYVSDKDADPNLYIRSALGREKETQLTRTANDVLYPALSPDGDHILYCSGPNEIRLVKPDGTGGRLLVRGNFGGRFGDRPVWSPDSRYVAVVEVVNGQRDIFAVSIEDGSRIKLTDTAYDESNPVWSPDGTFMLFTSNRSGHSFPEFTGKWDIYQLHFAPRQPEFKEDDFEKLFTADSRKDDTGAKKEKKDPEKKRPAKEVQVVFQLDNIRLQTEQVTGTPGNDRQFILSPKDTSTVYFVTDIDGKSHFWKTTLKKKGRGQYTPFLPEVTGPGALTAGPGGNHIYYLSAGKIGRISLAGPKNSTVSFDHRIKVQKSDDYRQMLGEVYYTLQHYFYDADHHNADWESLYRSYLPVLEQVRCDEDFYHYANELIGHLNSSHTGISGPSDGLRTENPTGHTGADWKTGNDVRVASILRDGPLWHHRDSVSVGDRLLEINGKAVEPAVNLWKQFNGTLNKRLILTFESRSLGRPVSVKVKAVSAGAENNLRKEAWIRSNKETVKKLTGDRAAYIYMSAMGTGDLNRFLLELERDAVPRDGLILDLRWNMGGNVHDRVLNALTKPVYGAWRVRGMEASRQSTFGFADTPVVLLTNETTLSDGEMTASGFKALDRGTIVGATTYGWLIFTTSARLMNGGSFRLPFWGCYTLDGVNLETHGGVTPHIEVINTLADELAGKDPQLQKAVDVLLNTINE